MSSSSNDRLLNQSSVSILGWTGDLILSLVTIGLLYLLGFRPIALNGALITAIFTVIISSTAVFFTSFTSNAELVLAVRNSGNFSKMISLFAIPVIASLIGLIFSVIATFFQSPDWILNLVPSWIPTIVILFLLFYAMYGFIGTIAYVLVLLSLTSIMDGMSESN